MWYLWKPFHASTLLFQLDDFQHFSERVYSDFSLHVYDIVHEPAGGHNLKRFGDVIPVQCSGKRVKHDSSLDFNLRVRAVSTCQSMDIILDSGSDVTLVPLNLTGVGTQVKTQSETYLRDAQGKQIATHDVRDVNFSFETADGSVVNVKERAFFSDRIDTPLISLGKLIKAGWCIGVSNGGPVLSHSNGAHIPLAFRNNSLTVSGSVRMIQDVRAISVDLPRTWQQLKQGWYSTDL